MNLLIIIPPVATAIGGFVGHNYGDITKGAVVGATVGLVLDIALVIYLGRSLLESKAP